MSYHYIYGTAREYKRVLFFSFFTFGIYYIIYQWWLFKDLEEHFKRAFSMEQNSYPTRNNSTTMFVYLLLLPIYSFYVKYNILHEHIATSEIKSRYNCVAGFNVIIIFILFSFGTLFIVPLIIEYRWQKAFNEHIRAHEANHIK